MAATTFSPVYDELVTILAEEMVPEHLLTFRLSSGRQERLDSLLSRNREGTLTPDETAELDGFAHFEHVVRMLKSRALQARGS